MGVIANERSVLSHSLWAATANDAPDRPAIADDVTSDCVIIGAGFTGLSAALHLAQTGARITVLEAETPGWGASGRNGGQVNPGLQDGPDALEAQFGPEIGRRMTDVSGGGGDLVFGLIAQHGIDCDANRVGWIRAAHTRKALDELESLADQWRARGAAVEPLSRDELTRLLGVNDYLGGTIDRRGGNLHPLNYALGLADAAERHGAQIFGDSRVMGYTTKDGLVTVKTAGGSVTAPKVLVCTNAYTGDLGKPLGKSVMPVTSVQVATAPLSDNIAQSILPEGHAVSDSRRVLIYFRKDAAGRFIIGGRGATRDASVRARQAALRAKAEQLYPLLKGVEWTHAWGGDVALTRDHLPGLHLLASGVMAGLGYNGRGVGMATVMGKVLADWASGVPDDALDFPVTKVRPIPFHQFRNLGLGPTVAALRLLDRVGL